MNRRVAHLSSNLHGLFATGSIRSRAVLCRRCIHSCKRWGESSVWWVSEEETYSKSNRQKLTLVLAEAELLLPSLPAPVAQRCAVLLKTCATGAGDAVAFFFFFFCKRNITGLPWLGFSSSVYSRLLLQFRLEMFLTSPGMFKTSLDKVQDRGTST